jgi:hypothetical protein
MPSGHHNVMPNCSGGITTTELVISITQKHDAGGFVIKLLAHLLTKFPTFMKLTYSWQFHEGPSIDSVVT